MFHRRLAVFVVAAPALCIGCSSDDAASAPADADGIDTLLADDSSTPDTQATDSAIDTAATDDASDTRADSGTDAAAEVAAADLAAEKAELAEEAEQAEFFCCLVSSRQRSIRADLSPTRGGSTRKFPLPSCWGGGRGRGQPATCAGDSIPNNKNSASSSALR